MPEWFENNSFWIEMYNYLFPDEKFEKADEEVQKILDLVKFQGETVLDLCCGPGRHSCALAQKELKVTAVDRTVFLLNKAKERVKAKNVEVEFVEEDMRNFVRSHYFDLIINMFTSFGYFEDKNDDLQVLQNMYTSLKPGGACMIDVKGKENLAKIHKGTTSEETADGSILVQRHEIFDSWSRIRNEWILIKSGRATSFKFFHTIYSGQELKDRLYHVGFTRIKIFGSLEGDEYGSDSTRLIAVAWK
jgi:SAM-dependent methyltransferase